MRRIAEAIFDHEFPYLVVAGPDRQNREAVNQRGCSQAIALFYVFSAVMIVFRR